MPPPSQPETKGSPQAVNVAEAALASQGKIAFLSPSAFAIATQEPSLITPLDILVFIKSAQPGSSVLYYDGYIGQELKNREVRAKQMTVMALYGYGLVTLTQKKITNRRYQYLMIKRPPQPEFPRLVTLVELQVKTALSQNRY